MVKIFKTLSVKKNSKIPVGATAPTGHMLPLPLIFWNAFYEKAFLKFPKFCHSGTSLVIPL